MSIRRWWGLALLVVVSVRDGSSPARADASSTTTAAIVPAVTAPDSDSLRVRQCRYGIMMAFTGQPARAESSFMNVLSRSPSDARAFNNLGNLHLMRGDPEVALAFYDLAVRADSTDAGIRINRATARLLMGQSATAQAEAASGVALAGSPVAAAELVGLTMQKPIVKGSDPGAHIEMTVGHKSGPRRRVTESELRTLLGIAPQTDSRKPASGGGAKPAGVGTDGQVAVNQLATKGADEGATDAAATMLYWKR